MNKEDLRPVQYRFDYKDRKLRNGYFHAWCKSAQIENPSNETIFGLIENEKGEMIYVEAELIKFLDR